MAANSVKSLGPGKDPPEAVDMIEIAEPPDLGMEVTIQTTVTRPNVEVESGSRETRQKRARSSDEDVEERERILWADCVETANNQKYNSTLVLTGTVLDTHDQVEVCEALTAAVGELRGRQLRSGEYLLHPENADQRNRLLGLRHLLSGDVSVAPYRRDSPTQGIIRGVARKYTEDQLLRSFGRQGVVTVKFLDSKKHEELSGDRLASLARTVLVTFHEKTLPDRLMHGFESYQVKSYVPTPIQCFRCLAHGHIRATCRRSEACGWCGGQHAQKSCPNLEVRPRCRNCKGEHSATSPYCSARKIANEVVEEVLATGRPYMEVRREVAAKVNSRPVSFAAAVAQPRKSSMVQSRSVESVPTTAGSSSQSPLSGRASRMPPHPADNIPQEFRQVIFPLLQGLVEVLARFLTPKGPMLQALRSALALIDGK